MIPGTKYEIDLYGLKNSARTNKDGKVYVGSLEKNSRNNIVNDIVIARDKDPKVEDRHFVI